MFRTFESSGIVGRTPIVASGVIPCRRSDAAPIDGGRWTAPGGTSGTWWWRSPADRPARHQRRAERDVGPPFHARPRLSLERFPRLAPPDFDTIVTPMSNRPRPRRVAVRGGCLRLANTTADLVNVSRTGALIRLNHELRTGGEWPLVLQLPTADPVWLHGRVVRCQRVEPGGGTALRNQYVLGLKFVNPPAEAEAMLDGVCGTPPRPAAAPADGSPARRRWLRVSLLHLRPPSLSLRRRCPECRSVEVTKEGRYRYSCDQCALEFVGIRVGPLRLSL